MVDTSSLSREAREAGCAWKAFHLLTLGDEVLGFMRNMGEANPDQHLRFCYQGSTQAVVCSLVQGGGLPPRIHGVLRP